MRSRFRAAAALPGLGLPAWSRRLSRSRAERRRAPRNQKRAPPKTKTGAPQTGRARPQSRRPRSRPNRRNKDAIMAHKKGGGSSRNGRDSQAQRLGVKKYGGEHAPAGP